MDTGCIPMEANNKPMAGQPGLGDNAQDVQAAFREMSMMMTQAQEVVGRMQNLWWQVIVPMEKYANREAMDVPLSQNATEVSGMPRANKQEMDFDQGADLDKTKSSQSVKSVKGTPANIPTGNLMDLQNLSFTTHPAVDNAGIQEPPGLLPPKDKYLQPGTYLSGQSQLGIGPDPALMPMAAFNEGSKLFKTSSNRSTEMCGPNLMKHPTNISTAAPSEMTDEELEMSRVMSGLSSFSELSKRPSVFDSRMPIDFDSPVPLEKSRSEPPVSRLSNMLGGPPARGGLSSRDGKVMEMMGMHMETGNLNQNTMYTSMVSNLRHNSVPRDTFDNMMRSGSSVEQHLDRVGYLRSQMMSPPTNHLDQDTMPDEDQASFHNKMPPHVGSGPVRQQQQQGGVGQNPMGENNNATTATPLAKVPGQAPWPATNLEDGTAPSLGSLAHESGSCKPCLFWYHGLCHKARRCAFCHIPHHPNEVSRVRPSKKTRNLLQQQTTRRQGQGWDEQN